MCPYVGDIGLFLYVYVSVHIEWHGCLNLVLSNVKLFIDIKCKQYKAHKHAHGHFTYIVSGCSLAGLHTP